MEPPVGLSPWLLAADGTTAITGEAAHHGNLAIPDPYLWAPVGLKTNPSGGGYRMPDSHGHVTSFGHAAPLPPTATRARSRAPGPTLATTRPASEIGGGLNGSTQHLVVRPLRHPNGSTAATSAWLQLRANVPASNRRTTDLAGKGNRHRTC